MKKTLIIVIAALVAVGLVYKFGLKEKPADQSSTGANTTWQTYESKEDGYSVNYPPGFVMQTNADGQVEFVNKDVTQEGQPAFISIVLENNIDNLSLTDWWQQQIKEGNRRVLPEQQDNLNRTVGGRQAIVLVPNELGSTNYIFELDHKIISLYGFLAEPYIDQVVASFKTTTASTPTDSPPSSSAPAAGTISAQGTMVCLPHRNPGEFQTLECAFGLKDDAGRYYALSDTDPVYGNISSVPMGVRVEVQGQFTPKEDTQYQSIGTIQVTKIVKL